MGAQQATVERERPQHPLITRSRQLLPVVQLACGELEPDVRMPLQISHHLWPSPDERHSQGAIGTVTDKGIKIAMRFVGISRQAAKRLLGAVRQPKCTAGTRGRSADLLGLPRPPRVTRAQARELLPASQMSFMDESRRLTNGRLVRELRLELRYPSVREGLRAP